MNKKIVLLILLQLSVIIFLGHEIYKKKIKKYINIIPIRKDSITNNRNSKLKYFYEPKPNSLQREKPKWATNEIYYDINADALRERIDYSINKDKDVFRIITLGDSHTFGLFIQQDESWPKVLEKNLNSQECSGQKFEVINLGVQGYDIQYAIERYRIRGQKYKPDLVIWLIKGDDFTQINEKMLKIRSELKEEMHNKTGLEQWNITWNELVRQLGKDNLINENASLINGISKYYSGGLIVMGYPHTGQKEYETVVNFSKGRRNTYLFTDMPSIYQRNDLNFYPYDSHPNNEGHRTIADSLLKYLMEKSFIPCK